MKFKFKEPGGITAFGIEISSDEWTEVKDETAVNKLRNNSHFECQSTGKATPSAKAKEAEETPYEPTKTPRRRRSKGAA